MFILLLSRMNYFIIRIQELQLVRLQRAGQSRARDRQYRNHQRVPGIQRKIESRVRHHVMKCLPVGREHASEVLVFCSASSYLSVIR